MSNIVFFNTYCQLWYLNIQTSWRWWRIGIINTGRTISADAFLNTRICSPIVACLPFNNCSRRSSTLRWNKCDHIWIRTFCWPAVQTHIRAGVVLRTAIHLNKGRTTIRLRNCAQRHRANRTLRGFATSRNAC